MGSPSVLGVAVGLAASGLSVARNLDDPHRVSIVPDLLTGVALAALVSAGIGWAIRHQPPRAGREAGLQTSLVAAIVCAAVTGVFTRWYLPTQALWLAAFAAMGSFGVVFAVGVVTTLVRTRSHQVA